MAHNTLATRPGNGLRRLTVCASIVFLSVFLSFVLVGCNAGERSKRSKTTVERVDLPSIEATEADSVEQLWSFDVGDGGGDRSLDLTAGFADGVVYAADPSGRLTAVNASDGSVKWTVDIGEAISAGVGIGQGAVFVADDEGRVYSVDAENGEQNWRVSVGGEVLAPPVIDSSTVIVRTVAGRVSGLRISDGERRWAYQRTVPALSLRGTAPPAIYEGVALTSFASGKLVANEVESGTILWEYDVVSPTGRNEIDRMIDLDATPVLVGSVLYLAAFQGEVIALSLGTRKVLWRKSVSSFRDIAADDNTIYVTGDDGQVYAFDRLSGDERWTQAALRGYSETGPTVFGDRLLIGDDDGRLHLLGRESGALVGRVDAGAILGGKILSDGDRFYALSLDGRLYAFKRASTG